MKHMRLPNGFGRITKITNKRLRNPYRAMVTLGFVDDKYKTKIIGYFGNYNEAYKALLAFHDNKNRLDITLSELYEEWLPFAIEDSAWSDSYRKVMENCWRYVSIGHMYVRNILPSDIRANLLEKGIPNQVRVKMKNLFNGIFRYAVQECIIEHSPAVDVRIPKTMMREINSTVKVKSIFTEDEIRLLAKQDNEYADMILYQIYSGWRMAEIVSLTKTDVNLALGYVVGGVKTAAGKGRAVPIHSAIRHIIEKYMKTPGEQLFSLNYNYYNNHFRRYMKSLGLSHTSHECRKTFATMGKMNGMDEYILKRILGHAISDITEKIYTERPIESLKEEIEKIPDYINEKDKPLSLSLRE